MESKPVVPKAEVLGGTRMEWDLYHQAAALYYDGMDLTLEEIYEIVPADRKRKF